jgi:hypothetical protein
MVNCLKKKLIGLQLGDFCLNLCMVNQLTCLYLSNLSINGGRVQVVGDGFAGRVVGCGACVAKDKLVFLVFRASLKAPRLVHLSVADEQHVDVFHNLGSFVYFLFLVCNLFLLGLASDLL